MSERNFWLLLKGALGMQIHRIENKMASGTPDIHFIHKGISGWIELKYISDWSKKAIFCGLSRNQVLWLQDYALHGGNCWILIRVGRESTAVVHGSKANRLLKSVTIEEFFKTMAWYKSGKMTKSDWVELTNLLLNSQSA